MAAKTMEEVFREIQSLKGLDGLSNGRVLVSLFSDLSTDKKDLRLVRYLVESGCHKDLLEARELSPAMQQARLQQTINKLSAETLISDEAAQQVCQAFWNVACGAISPPDQNTLPKKEEPQLQEPRKNQVPSTPEIKPAILNAKTESAPRKEEHTIRMAAEQPESSEKHAGAIKPKIIVAVLLLILVLPVVLFFTAFYVDTAEDTSDTQAAVTEETPEEISLSEYIQRTESKNGSRVLRADPFQYNLDENGRLATYPAFGTNLMRDQIVSVTFLNTLKDAPAEVVDLSEANDGSVQSWVVPNGDLYDLYIAAEGGVKAPIDSSGLFALYVNATSISFNNSFDTSNAVSMYMMFYECNSLIEVDLRGMDTENANAMDFFFDGCKQLTTVDISHFDTSAVTSFAYMFADCSSLKTIAVDNLDTSKAEYMAGMFSGCSGLEKLDLSTFDTASVTDMSFMFDTCTNLTQLDISSFDTSSVTDMRYMFYGATKLQNLDLSGFDVSNVTDYERFMKDGMKINGRPWEQLFTK